MKTAIESLLFISAKPLSVNDLAKAIGQKEKKEEIQAIVESLRTEYNTDERGIHIIEVEQKGKKKYQMTTNPNQADLIKKFTKQELTGELTRPSLEALTIIAYKGPITKPELEKIRGVNCSLILRNLMIRSLVEESADKETGNIYYSATAEFVKWLGLDSVKDLPEYAELSQHELIEQALETETEN